MEAGPPAAKRRLMFPWVVGASVAAVLVSPEADSCTYGVRARIDLHQHALLWVTPGAFGSWWLPCLLGSLITPPAIAPLVL